MIIIKDKICSDIDKTLKYFEPSIGQLTNLFLGNHPEKDDCKQMLRLKLWKLFKNKDRIFNTSYVNLRLKLDTINFINRDYGYNWNKKFISLETFEEHELNELLLKLGNTCDIENVERDIEIEDILVKAKPQMTERQYEALILFLSGAPSDLIRKFLGTRSRNMTRYYLLLAESFAILRECVDENTED